MGWWSETVLGGDEPLDFIGDFEETCGIIDDNDDDVGMTADQRRKAINKNIAALRHLVVGEVIGTQVLGAFIITNGAKMSNDVKRDVIAAINDDEIDGWDDQRRRKMFMNNFKRQIQRYPVNVNAQPRQIAEEGLFETMVEHIAKGKGGLINK